MLLTRPVAEKQSRRKLQSVAKQMMLLIGDCQYSTRSRRVFVSEVFTSAPIHGQLRCTMRLSCLSRRNAWFRFCFTTRPRHRCIFCPMVQIILQEPMLARTDEPIVDVTVPQIFSFQVAFRESIAERR